MNKITQLYCEIGKLQQQIGQLMNDYEDGVSKEALELSRVLDSKIIIWMKANHRTLQINSSSKSHMHSFNGMKKR